MPNAASQTISVSEMVWKFICQASVQLTCQPAARKTCRLISIFQRRKRGAFRNEDKLDNSLDPWFLAGSSSNASSQIPVGRNN
jgi:hypothetical protein